MPENEKGETVMGKALLGVAGIVLVLVLALPLIAGLAGNGDTASRIAELEYGPVMSGGRVAIEDFYAAMIGTLGVQSQEAGFMRENQEMMVEHLKYQQDAVAGVSLDEEMTHLIRYQHAYQAAARLVSTVDQMLQTVLNMV